MNRIRQAYMNLAAAILNENCGDDKFLSTQWAETLRDFCGVADGKKPDIKKASSRVQNRAVKQDQKVFCIPEDPLLKQTLEWIL